MIDGVPNYITRWEKEYLLWELWKLDKEMKEVMQGWQWANSIGDSGTEHAHVGGALWIVQERRNSINIILNWARVLSDDLIVDDGIVSIGKKLVVELESGETMTLVIGGIHIDKNHISVRSPFARALIWKWAGDYFEFRVGQNEVSGTIVSVEIDK